MNRRGFLVGLFAPAIIRTPGLLMPVRVLKPTKNWLHISGIYPAPGTIKFEYQTVEGGPPVADYMTGEYAWSARL
jgi:hypothetical protein